MIETSYKRIEEILEKNGIEFDMDLRTLSIEKLSRVLGTVRGEVSDQDLTAIKGHYDIIKKAKLG